jgi:hypothetical protein
VCIIQTHWRWKVRATTSMRFYGGHADVSWQLQATEVVSLSSVCNMYRLYSGKMLNLVLGYAKTLHVTVGS